MSNVYEEALKKWGEPLQIIMGIEEMAELTQALIKHLRGKGNPDNIREEMADVEIMLTQLKSIFGDYRWIKDKKLVRLAEMVKGSQSQSTTHGGKK